MDKQFRKAHEQLSHWGRLQNTQEISDFFDLVKANKCRHYLEIGSRRGYSAYVMAHAMPEGSVITLIDYPNAKFGDAESLQYLCFVVKELLYRKYRVNLILGDSTWMSTRDHLKNLTRGLPAVDCLFIDGDHSLEGVKHDFITYGPLVKRGGIIGIHDIKAPENLMDTKKYWDFLHEKTQNKTEEIYHHNYILPHQMGIGIVRP